jgi:hypothetical protein
MNDPPQTNPQADLATRLEDLGRTLGAREAAHSGDLAEARRHVELLRARVEAALERFHTAANRAGAPDLRIDLSEVRNDDKHLRAVEFDLTRGRHKAVVTGKSRGEITLVGPFRDGKAEGPCKSFPFDATAEISAALGDFLEAFLEQAATP